MSTGGSTANVTNGEIAAAGDYVTVCVDGDGSLTVEGGTITSENSNAVSVYGSWADAKITGGTITAEGAYPTVYVNDGELTVGGGEIISKGNTNAVCVENSTTEITGGVFSDDSAWAYVEPGYELVKNEAGYVLSKCSDNAASAGGQEYKTLAEAVAYANTNGGEVEVKLLASVVLDQILTISETVTLDLNGHALIGMSKTAYLCVDGGSLTITDESDNGQVKMLGADYYAIVAKNTSNLTLESGTIDAARYGVSLQDDSNLYVKGVLIRTVADNGYAVAPAGGNVYVQGGTVSAPRNIAIGMTTQNKTNTVTVESGSVESGNVAGAAAIYNKYDTISLSVTISGGTVSGIILSLQLKANDSLTVTGGMIKGNVSITAQAENISITHGKFSERAPKRLCKRE